MWLRITTVACILAVACAATFRAKLPEKPIELAHKPGCYVREINDVIPFGEEVTPAGMCARIECSKHSIYYATCATITNEDSNCYLTAGNPSRSFPDCCPELRCSIENDIQSKYDWFQV